MCGIMIYVLKIHCDCEIRREQNNCDSRKVLKHNCFVIFLQNSNIVHDIFEHCKYIQYKSIMNYISDKKYMIKLSFDCANIQTCKILHTKHIALTKDIFFNHDDLSPDRCTEICKSISESFQFHNVRVAGHDIRFLNFTHLIFVNF